MPNDGPYGYGGQGNGILPHGHKIINGVDYYYWHGQALTKEEYWQKWGSKPKGQKYIYSAKQKTYIPDPGGPAVGDPDPGAAPSALHSEWNKLFELPGVHPILKGKKPLHDAVSPEVVDPDDPFSG